EEVSPLNPFEYLLVLAAVILGLAISDLAVSANRLLEAGDRVKWDWLAPLAAVVAFFKIVTEWGGWVDAEAFCKRVAFEMCVGVLVSAVLLFLLAGAAFPDQIEKGDRFDLADYYRRIVRRYWLIFAAHLLVSFAVSIWVQMTIKNGGA